MDKWYGIWVLTGKEQDAKRRIRAIPAVEAVLMPQAVLWQRRDGAWQEVIQTLFPGYLFVRCRMDAGVYHAIRDLPEVIGWLAKDMLYPQAVSPEDMDRVHALMGDTPGRVLTDIHIRPRQRRGYGTICLQGKSFRVPFNAYDDHKQADVPPGDASPGETVSIHAPT